MALIDVDKIRERMALPDKAEIITALESSLRGAEATLENLLQTSFKRSATSDVFYWQPLKKQAIDGFVRLKLRNGFVVNKPTALTPVVPVVYMASTAPGIMSGGILVPPTDYRVDYEKGHVYTLNPSTDPVKTLSGWDSARAINNPQSLQDVYYKVEYSSGFSNTNDVPPWLQELALAYTIINTNMQQVTNRNADFDTIVTHLKKEIAVGLDLHRRNFPLALIPIF